MRCYRGRQASCFSDGRSALQVKHRLLQMLAQRLYGLALGYEDVNDHEQLRNDPLLAVLSGKRDLDAPLAGKSTLNRLELVGRTGRYHKIGYSAPALDRLLGDLFLESRSSAPEQIVLDLAATSRPENRRRLNSPFLLLNTASEPISIGKSAIAATGIAFWLLTVAGRAAKGGVYVADHNAPFRQAGNLLLVHAHHKLRSPRRLIGSCHHFCGPGHLLVIVGAYLALQQQLHLVSMLAHNAAG